MRGVDIKRRRVSFAFLISFPFHPFIPVVCLSPYFGLKSLGSPSYDTVSKTSTTIVSKYMETIIFRGKSMLTVHRYMACHNLTLKYKWTGLVPSPQWLGTSWTTENLSSFPGKDRGFLKSLRSLERKTCIRAQKTSCSMCMVAYFINGKAVCACW